MLTLWPVTSGRESHRGKFLIFFCSLTGVCALITRIRLVAGARSAAVEILYISFVYH